MKITVNVFKANDNAKKAGILANANIVIEDCFKVSGFVIRAGKEGKGNWVSFPSEKGKDGKYYNTFNGIVKGANEKLSNKILKAYEEKAKEEPEEASEDDIPF